MEMNVLTAQRFAFADHGRPAWAGKPKARKIVEILHIQNTLLIFKGLLRLRIVGVVLSEMRLPLGM